MKTFKIGLLILVCLAFGCKKEEQLTGCDLEIDLGTFPLSEESKSIFSYTGHFYEPFFNLDRTDSIHLNINNPAILEQELQWRNETSNCGLIYQNSDGENFVTADYSYTREMKYTTVSIEVHKWNDSLEFSLITTSSFEAIDGEYTKINESLFWHREPYGQLSSKDFFYPLAIVPLQGKPKLNNDTYEFYPELNLNDKGFSNVYILKSNSSYNTLYLTLEEGIIGVEIPTDTSSVLYTID